MTRLDRSSPDRRTKVRGVFHRHRGWWIALGVVLALLVLIHLVASPIAESVVNRKLAAMEGFTGEVGDLKLALWRNSIEIQDLVIRDSEHPDDLPVVRVKKATLSGALRPMIEGKLGGRAMIEGAEFTIVKRQQFDGLDEAMEEAEETIEDQRRKAKRWERAMREALPMEMSHIEMKDSKVRFVDRSHDPQVDVGINQLQVEVTGLRNRPDPEGLPLEVKMSGVTTGQGQLDLYVRADPMAEPLQFFTTFELRDLQLPPFNNFMLAYTETDVSAGTFDVYIEAEAEGGRYEGYVKPFFTDLDFDTVSDEQKGFFANLKENVVSAAASLLENDETEKVATQTPFSGEFGQNDVELWTAVENLLRNAFVQALREGLAGQTPAAE